MPDHTIGRVKGARAAAAAASAVVGVLAAPLSISDAAEAKGVRRWPHWPPPRGVWPEQIATYVQGSGIAFGWRLNENGWSHQESGVIREHSRNPRAHT